MDSFLDYIEKYKWAILGTALVHIIAFFYVNFKTVERPFKLPSQEIEMSVPIDEIEFDPEIMEQLKLNDKQPTEEITNLSADENDKREKSYEDYSSQELDEMVESEAKELEQKYFDEWAATHGDQGNNSSDADIDLNEKNERNDRNPVDKNNMDNSGSNAFAGEVMVSYNLPSRKAHSLPRPGYTCNSSGTVVIDVKVDQSGVVKNASYNSSLSRSATECMVERAMRYAKKSRFNFSGSSSGSQNGTITYKFVSK